MLIPLHTLITKYTPRITGIIHVGAHFAEEHKDYLNAGVTKVAYIEACRNTYSRLTRMQLDGDVSLHHTALADYEGQAEMYTETANMGQSSSLLKPGTHTTHYPSIQFNGRETVSVTTMDKLNLKGYNMLNLDVQGAELMVLKGGEETLRGIDYIYTEVNREPVYEGCAMIDDMDEFLAGFERVETVWTGQGWGDAFYVRVNSGDTIVQVPPQYQYKMPFPYPADNKYEFERWFFNHVRAGEIRGRKYLPILWTAYYVRTKYGKDKHANAVLQDWLNKLPKIPYFTIVQYDDGILHDLSGLDIKVFSMGGGRVDYPLPLICEPHPPLQPVTKDIFCSFVGIITHKCRQDIVEQLAGKPGYYISTKPHSMAKFTEILNRSKFVLCPRGYGKTSFRIQEALQYGATPIYISDEHINPHWSFDEYGYALKPGVNFEAALNQLEPKQLNGAYEKYFTYRANKKLILENL